MIKLNLKRFFRETIVGNRAEKLSEKAEVMLSLDVQKDRETMTHDLHLTLLGLTPFIHQDTGEHIHYVAESGIILPDPDRSIATIQFYTPSQAQDFSFVERLDEEWGKTYAFHDDIIEAWAAIDEQISDLEAHIVCVKDACPTALSDRNGPAIVSVANYWTYFKRFRHDPRGRVSQKGYHSERDQNTPHLEILPGGAQLLSIRRPDIDMWAELGRELAD